MTAPPAVSGSAADAAGSIVRRTSRPRTVRNEPQFEAISTDGRYPVPSPLFEHDAFGLDFDRSSNSACTGPLDGVAVMIGETSA
jgi:hypothetical protein